MFLTLVRIFPSAKELEAVRMFLMGLLEPTRVQPGCLGCTLATESDPEALLYMETWQSMEHLLPRLRSEEYGKVLATMELSTSKPDVWIYEIANEQGLELIERARMASTNQGEAAP